MLANGWDIGVYDTNNYSPIKVIKNVGCAVLHPDVCTYEDALTTVFNPLDEREIIFAGNDGIGRFNF